MSPKIIYKVPLRAIFKEYGELIYWRIRKLQEKKLGNDHYAYFYTENFDLTPDFYRGKNILDLGCGPRGSLEWADMTESRIGLDPLAEDYLKLGAHAHKMTYIKGYGENMPFDKEQFDLVCSFNNLDHVNNLKQTCIEIDRVLKPGGLFLLIVDIHAKPTTTEPQTLAWNLISVYFPQYKILEEKHLERSVKNKIYTNSRKSKPVSNEKIQSGVLKVKLQKV
ncbi:MAG: class I SAM-dependent methyltransferase [Bacteroidetes bacterium]|nr:class I SAM-dependent methyltransferase [Bacteroidota bacterium]